MSTRTEADQGIPRDGDLLTPDEAAIHLGITPELLFSYTRKRFRKSDTQTRRLQSVEQEGRTWFRREELDSFDRYLREPWAQPGADRTDPPKCVVDHIRAESGNQCIRCGSGIGVATAHIVAWAASRSHHHNNLIRICSRCHVEHDEHNSLPSEVLARLKDEGISRIRATVAARSQRHIRTVIPAPDPLFVGRREVLEDLCESLRSSRAIVIRGVGGVGKTQLLLQALARVGSRCLIWLDAEKFRSTADVRCALDAAVRQRAVTLHGTTQAVLDSLPACVVFDGMERVGGQNVDELEDLLCELQIGTSDAQLVVTSQVDLPRFACDEHFVVGGLDAAASQEVLSSSLRESTQCDHDSMLALQALSDGHPLTLRLVGALSNHYGATLWALQQIERRGAAELQMPKRTRHTPETSLSVCLSLAYEVLEPDEAYAAFLVASCPGGIYSALIATERWIPNGRAAIAGLQRWSLIETALRGHPHERLAMLSPVALFVESRWCTERPERASRIVDDLMHEFTVLTGVIQERTAGTDAIPYMLARYEQELPNLMRLLETAETRGADHRRVQSVLVVCTALMRYFFVLNLPERGVEVMLRGARIAMTAGDMRGSSDLLVQAAALASRGDDLLGLHAVDAFLSEVLKEASEADAKARANVELVSAMFDSRRGTGEKAERHARRAIELFREHRSAAPMDDEDAANDLSAAHDLLGLSLLLQRNYSGALVEYRTAMSLLRGSSIAVNRGQLFHQIANCEGGLGDHGSAAGNYIRAALHFQKIGMRDFVGNAFGELGHALLEISDAQWPNLEPCNDLVPAALDDLARDVVRSLDNGSASGMWEIVRKLFGAIVVVTATEAAGQLVQFSSRVNADVVDQENRLDEFDDLFTDGIDHVKGLIVLAAYVGVLEKTVRTSATPVVALPTGALDDLSSLCLVPVVSPELQHQCFRWLTTYMRRRWDLSLDPDVLLEAARQVHGLPPFHPGGSKTR